MNFVLTKATKIQQITSSKPYFVKEVPPPGYASELFTWLKLELRSGSLNVVVFFVLFFVLEFHSSPTFKYI